MFVECEGIATLNVKHASIESKREVPGGDIIGQHIEVEVQEVSLARNEATLRLLLRLYFVVGLQEELRHLRFELFSQELSIEK